MNPAQLYAVTAVTVVGIAGTVVLLVTGKGDAASIGVISALLVQFSTLVVTNKISVIVNGHLSKLIQYAVTSSPGGLDTTDTVLTQDQPVATDEPTPEVTSDDTVTVKS